MRISDWSSDVCSSDLLRAILAVTGCEYILWPHRRADADMCGFMAEARGVGAELAGALQGHRFAVEGTHQQHLLVQIDQILAVLGELGHVLAHRLAVGCKVLQVFNLETDRKSKR